MPQPSPTVDRRYQVFVSSTYKDLIEKRQLVMKTLMQVNAIPAGMELFPPADDDAWTLIQRSIEQSDYYIVVIGGRYGSTAPDGTGFTEREYDHAVKMNKPVIALLHKRPESLQRDHTETDPKLWQRLLDFRAKAEKKHCAYWETDAELIADVLQGYLHAQATRPATGWVRGDYAKTLQEIERAASLQQRVTELEAEIAKARAAQEDGTEDFAQGSDEVTLSATIRGSGREVNATYSWDQVITNVGVRLTQNPSADAVMYGLAQAILRKAEPSAAFLSNGDISRSSFLAVQYQLMALKLIFVEPDGHDSLWRLTERGQAKLARLLASKRPRPGT